MNPKRILLLLFFLYPFVQVEAQSDFTLSDTLRAERKLFTTKVYRNDIALGNPAFELLLGNNLKWSRKFKIAKIILPAGPVVAASGIYLAYDAIKGIPKVAIIDGVQYDYKVRSLPKLLGGIAIFVGGMSMIESANETKANATNWYNGYLIKELDKKSAFDNSQFRMGLQESGRVGFALKF